MPAETKSSGVGIVLSFFWTGLGQLYAGRIGRGLGMMVATPIIWMISLFGGGMSVLGGLASIGGAMQQSQTGDASGLVAGGGVGIVGLLMALLAVVWWVWGMIDARRLCEQFNASAAS